MRTADPIFFMVDVFANASRHPIKLLPRAPFSGGMTAGNGDSPGGMAGFRGEDGSFYGAGHRTALRASQAVHATDVMVNTMSW